MFCLFVSASVCSKCFVTPFLEESRTDMANFLFASGAAASATLATRSSVLHACSCQYPFKRLASNSVVPFRPLTPDPNKLQFYLPSSWGVFWCSSVAMPPNSRSLRDVSSRNPCRTGPSRRKCTSCGSDCCCCSDCNEAAVYSVPAASADAHFPNGAVSPRFSVVSPTLVLGSAGRNAPAFLRHHQQDRCQSFSSSSTGAAAPAVERQQRHALVLPTPPPIFNCTGSSSSYEEVADAVGDDATAASVSTHSLLQVTSMDFYETCVYDRSQTQPLVCCFVTRGSLRSKLLLQPFKELAVATTATRRSSSSNDRPPTEPLFLLIDCDDVPRAAYHARVEHVPSIVVMKKDDGFREIVSDPAAIKTATEMIQETKQALERLQQLEQQLPAGVQPGPSRYTKNIGIDNLNAYRVGWLTP